MVSQWVYIDIVDSKIVSGSIHPVVVLAGRSGGGECYR